MESDQQKFLRLVKELETLKETSAKVSEELEVLMKNLGVGSMFQDPNDGLVYKVIKPKGQFTYFQDIDYVRTAKTGEDRGSLSKKEAEGAGFVLKK